MGLFDKSFERKKDIILAPLKILFYLCTQLSNSELFNATVLPYVMDFFTT
jgi:hypothetical protein